MQRVKEKAIELLQNGTVDRVLGWRAGEFFYDLTPGCFSNVILCTASSPVRTFRNI